MCDIVEAYESETKYEELLSVIRNNIDNYGHYSIFPCSCGKHLNIDKYKILELNKKLLNNL